MIPRDGRVVTFYSFKGGVGRTMALANVAFLAAFNGLKVLVMDWDLEAPGIPYYFRGQLDPLDEAAMASRPGILDMVADWMRRAKAASSADEVEALTTLYKLPATFEGYTNALVAPDRLPQGGCLHAMTAGAARGCDPGKTAYERTLADLSWPDFFGPCAGGLLVDAVRTWAKSAYDLVLVDSRTGFADVAGICTVQLPDIVVLCYILNRQNLDGTAKVSAAVQRQRHGAVDLRLVPMRLSREGTSEEADAQAFARDVLRRVGLLSRERVDEDMQTLRIRAADGVPFYETLAPFVPNDPRKDPLTLDYATLAEALTGREIKVSVDSGWREVVRRRLEPRQATLAYIAELGLAEPSRARDEIDALLASAGHSAEAGRKLDENYVDALVKAAFDVVERLDVDFDTLSGPFDAVLGLLRSLTEKRPEVWRTRLIDALERMLTSHSSYVPHMDDAALMEEMDVLLAGCHPTASVAIRRAALRQRLARLKLITGDVSEALVSSDLADSLLATAEEATLDFEEKAMLRDAAVQGGIVRGDIRRQQGDEAAAIAEYEKTLDLSRSSADAAAGQGALLLRLVVAYLSIDPPAAAAPAIEWAKRFANPTTAFTNLMTMAEVATASVDPPEVAATLVHLLFPVDGAGSPERIPPYQGRFFGGTMSMRIVVGAARLATLVPAAEITVVAGMLAAVGRIRLRSITRGRFLDARDADVRTAAEELVAIALYLHLEETAERLTAFAEELGRLERRIGNAERDNGSA